MEVEQTTQQPWYRDERLLFAVIATLLIATLFWKGTEPEDSSTVAAPDTISPPRLPAPTDIGLYSPDAIDYFLDIAFGAEYGSPKEVIRKWQGDIVIRVSGNPTDEDMETLRKVVREINDYQDSVNLRLDRFDANVIFYIGPQSTFPDFEPHYQTGNPGYFWVHWRDDILYKARVMVDSRNLNQSERSSLIREELTQALGLMNVSSRYTDSIFNDYEDHYVDEYAPVDGLLIKMLYHPDVLPGLRAEEAQAVLYGLADKDGSDG